MELTATWALILAAVLFTAPEPSSNVTPFISQEACEAAAEEASVILETAPQVVSYFAICMPVNNNGGYWKMEEQNDRGIAPENQKG